MANEHDQPKELVLSLLHQLLDAEATRTIGVRLWDGTLFPDDTPRSTTIALNHPGALRSLLLAGTELEMAEAYLYDDCDVEGNLEALFELERLLTDKPVSVMGKLRAAGQLLKLPGGAQRPSSRRGPAMLTGKRHSVERDKAAIAYHYDVSNDFYALWLDRNMVYSCGYFETPESSLDEAQERKLDYICRKLRLQPGQRLLDIGCGWGGLVIHAAEKYGVDSTGITLSRPQVEYANEHIEALGLQDRCRVLFCDYRELLDVESYDAVVSVGMFEHVGEALLPTYFRKVMHLMRPGGVFLNHGIATAANVPRDGRRSFTDAYVFPDGELTPISVTLREAEAAGFEVRDVESLREHYVLTLRQWVKRLEERHDEAVQYVDEPTYRVWRLYMSGAAYGFKRGRTSVYQSLLVRPCPDGSSGMPLTREDWYRRA